MNLQNNQKNKSPFFKMCIFRRKSIILLISLILISFIYVSACSTDQSERPNESTMIVESPMNISQETPTVTRFTTATISFSTQPLVTPTRTMNPEYDLGDALSYTQGPVLIVTMNPEDNEFLYHDTLVTISLREKPVARVRLNLDDLSRNEQESSDIEVVRFTGMNYTYNLYSLNNAYIYKSENPSMDFNACAEHFPITGMTSDEYLDQVKFWLGDSTYCVLTDENRIAVVNYVKDSIKWADEFDTQELTFRITVYNKIVE